MTIGRKVGSLLSSACVLVSCSTKPQATPDMMNANAEQATANRSSEALVTPLLAPPAVATDTDTVDSLSKDVDGLQRDLIQYSGPLTPKQESEVESIQKKIESKETKKAKLELQKMLGDWKEEE